MKNLNLILLAILVLTFLASCDKDDNDLKKTLEMSTISAKWVVNSFSEFESFEFNESGYYIVVKNSKSKSIQSQIILFGTYEIKNNFTIVLSEFGTFEINEIDDNSITFSIQLVSNSDSEFFLEASKEEEIISSTRTNLLCKTWKLVSANGELVAGTNKEVIILISKTGTYFQSHSNRFKDGGKLEYWKWKDDTETQFLYSSEEVPVWDEEEDCVIIQELNSSVLNVINKEYTFILESLSSSN